MELDAALHVFGESTGTSIATFITFMTCIKYETMLFEYGKWNVHDEMYSLTAFVASVGTP